MGKFNNTTRDIGEAEELLTTVVEDPLEFKKRDSTLKLIKGKVYVMTGEFDPALELLQDSSAMRLELGNVFATAEPLNEIGILYAQKGELDQALSHLKQSLKIYKDARNRGQMVKIRNNIAMIYSMQGEHDLALESYQKALTLGEKIGNKRFIAVISMNMGLIYFDRGELNSALDYYQKSLTVLEELENKADIAKCLNNIGRVYETRGELDQALDFYQRSLTINEELNVKQEIATGLHNIGKIYHERGDFESASTHFEQSLQMNKKLGNTLDISETLSNLIHLAVIQKDFDTAQSRLDELQKINEKEKNKVIDQSYRLSKAVILRESDRVVKRAEAQQIFQQISEEEIINLDTTAEAMFNLCELLLLELQTSGSEEALNELKTILHKMLNFAEDQHNYSLFVETHLLQSKTALLELDVEKAKQLLAQAQQIAEEKGLVRLAMMASGEFDSLLDQISKWDSFIDSEVSMKERLELTRLENMVTRLIHKRTADIPIAQPEEPVMLLILSKTGLSLFSRSFGEESRVDDQLVGGFLTALTSFGSEIFSESGAIDRIMYEEYTVALRGADPLVFCYMFKGQSYTALQKLDQVLAEVRDTSSIWNGLLGTLDTGDILNTTETGKLENIINGIYES
ncbi:MAG: tetratricopeptide repeat protein [Candidatus Hodarchaeota archaeon]